MNEFRVQDRVTDSLKVRSHYASACACAFFYGFKVNKLSHSHLHFCLRLTLRLSSRWGAYPFLTFAFA